VSDEPTDEKKTEDPLAEEGDAENAPDASSPPQDAMSPEAIAKRVASLGGDDELERIARDEELKLAERKASARGGGGKAKKSSLEAAASKRLQKIGGKVPPKKIAYAADADVLIKGSGKFATWMRENVSTVVGVAIAGILGLLGAGVWAWRAEVKDDGASSAITAALDDEDGRIGDPSKEDEADELASKDPRPVFKTEAERRDAAIAKYRDVETKYKGTGAAYLARLEEGSLLLDKGDLDGAIAAYNDTLASPLAAADSEVKGRALEGVGFAYEAKAAADPGTKDKWLEQAAQQFRALENTDVKGFKELGMYDQARIAEEQGNKDKAIELLKSLHGRFAQAGSDEHPFVYLEQVADDRLGLLDPTAIPPKPKGGGMGGMGGMGGPGGGGSKLTEEQIQKILEQMKSQGGAMPPGAPPPGAPGAPPGPPGNK
jgi:hypothetical protein